MPPQPTNPKKMPFEKYRPFLPLVLEDRTWPDKRIEKAPLWCSVDLETRTVSAPAAGVEAAFEIDDFTRHRLLNGLDDIGLTLQHGGAIAAFESGRPGYLPSVGSAPAGLKVGDR